MGKKRSRVTKGMTFRSVYADSNALWETVQRKGSGVWLCSIVNEPIEIDGNTYDGDYAGVTDVFTSAKILQAIGMASVFEGIMDEHDKFYASCKVGDIVHYNNGFRNYVRCEVVRAIGVGGSPDANVLKPIALVGEWWDYDLPKRNVDGSIRDGYYAEKIKRGQTFTPNVTCIYESLLYSKKGEVDPATLPEINLSVPEMTDDEKQTAFLWKQVRLAHNTLNEAKDPADALRSVRKIIHKTLEREQNERTT